MRELANTLVNPERWDFQRIVKLPDGRVSVKGFVSVTAKTWHEARAKAATLYGGCSLEELTCIYNPTVGKARPT